jgi:SpoIID/LytB domain protein
MSVLTRAVRRHAKLIAAPLVALLVGAGVWMAAPPLAGAAASDITFNGRGFGHGRGMSQWGAYGYAVDYGSTYQGILNLYYGGTSLATDAGNPAVSVELLGMRNKETVISGPGLTVNGIPLGRQAVRIHGIASNTFEVLVGDSCSGPWSVWNGVANGQVSTGTEVTGEIRLCEASQVRAYRGHMVIVDGGGYQTTVNVVTIDDYLRGVIPREMPASWGSAGSGRGMEALKVQAVAARGYALASQWTSYAKTCDTTSCQVYAGAYTGPEGGGATWIEDSRSDAAVAATSGQVRRKPNGTIARTEFSASTGGWTAGGEFPAVQDLGDLTSANPNRSWSVPFSRASVASRLGIPAINDVRVTQRNGLGADGGRVLQVVFDTTGGQRTFTGNQVRIAMGLKSDWFTINTVSTASARSFSQALYPDILGRPGDPGGVDYWTNAVASGVSRYSVAMAFAGSGERYGQWVRTVYAAALGRAPDAGAEGVWSNYLANGATMNNLNAGVYGSPESVGRLGGGDVRLWVEAVYQNLLGRGSSDGERAVWEARANQYGLQSVVWAISTSAEACNRRLDAYYRAMLGRPADGGGLSTWGPYLAGTGDVTIVAALAASEEYAARAEARYPS